MLTQRARPGSSLPPRAREEPNGSTSHLPPLRGGRCHGVTEGGTPRFRSRVAVLVLGLITALALFASTSADEPSTASIALESGQTAVTWSGAEPYAIANFEGTPVTQIHRWDAVRQRWLTRVIGQEDATLPERHLLPRVQYLLASEGAYALAVSSPLADIDPRAELRMPAAPDDPLRFEAYWPNEDSPLEDLILLRPDDERLSVEAWVEGGVGEIEAYWVLDGRLNHQGLASDDVELLPGKHDNARLYAVDEDGQVAFVELPRVVKLPQVEIPEMVYGVNAWSLSWPAAVWRDQYTSREELVAVVQEISEVGLEFVRISIWMYMVLRTEGEFAEGISHYQWLFQTIRDAGLEPLPIIGPFGVDWARSADVSTDRGVLFNGQETRDVNHIEAIGRIAGRHWPSVTFFDVSNEPGIKQYRADLDPIREVQQQRAAALGILYENPSAVIVAGTPCCYWKDKWEGGIHGLTFLSAMYDAGFGPWHDVLGIHLSTSADRYNNEIDEARRIMEYHGDGDKPLWATETPAYWVSEEQYAELLLDHLRAATERDDLNGVMIWKIRDSIDRGSLTHPTEHASGIIAPEYRDGRLTLQPSGIAVRDFLRAQRGE